jgi:hypothetical protein
MLKKFVKHNHNKPTRNPPFQFENTQNIKNDLNLTHVTREIESANNSKGKKKKKERKFNISPLVSCVHVVRVFVSKKERKRALIF